jgi:hypothetical protein
VLTFHYHLFFGGRTMAGIATPTDKWSIAKCVYMEAKLKHAMDTKANNDDVFRTFSEPTQSCGACMRIATKTCPCKQVKYCDAACQAADRPVHKERCELIMKYVFPKETPKTEDEKKESDTVPASSSSSTEEDKAHMKEILKMIEDMASLHEAIARTCLSELQRRPARPGSQLVATGISKNTMLMAEPLSLMMSFVQEMRVVMASGEIDRILTKDTHEQMADALTTALIGSAFARMTRP